MDSSGRFVVVTASSGAAPFDLKLWVYEPPKVSPVSRICDILNPTFQGSGLFEEVAGQSHCRPIINVVGSNNNRLSRFFIYVSIDFAPTCRRVSSNVRHILYGSSPSLRLL